MAGQYTLAYPWPRKNATDQNLIRCIGISTVPVRVSEQIPGRMRIEPQQKPVLKQIPLTLLAAAIILQKNKPLDISRS
jgi:hypothetical protein